MFSSRKSFAQLVGSILLLLHSQLAWAQAAASKPIKRDSLLEVVQRNLLSTRELVQRVEQRGVDFRLTPQDETQFRQAGARPELLAAVRANYRGAAVNEVPSAPTPRSVVMPKPAATAPAKPGALGVVMMTLTPALAAEFRINAVSGALVRSVAPSGAAAKAGLRGGDVITQFNGKPIDAMERLRDYVASTPAGTKVHLTVWRAHRFENVPVVLGEMLVHNTAFTYDDLLDQSLAALQTNDWNLAGNLSSQAIKLNPAQPLAYGLLGYTLLYGRGDIFNAEQAMRAAIERGGAASFEVWHAQGSSFKDAVRGSLFISKAGVVFKSNLSADEFNVNDSEIKEAGLNGFFGREHNAFHLEVKTPSGKTRNYNFAPRTGNQLEALLILNLIRSY
jgi:hypothetical protein